MANDTVTLELSGDVALDDFSSAILHLRGLLTELSRDVAANTQIVWVIDALETGSALTAFRGQLLNGGRPQDIEEVVRAYAAVGSALESGEAIAYSPSVAREAYALASVLGDRVSAIRFETPETEATIAAPPSAANVIGLPPAAKVAAYGAAEGQVQTLSNRGGLRFTLYDTLHDRAVSCYFSEDFDQDLMRDVWGRRAIVEGLVTRDGATGRPLAIRRVSNVVPLPAADRNAYRQARGVMVGAWSDESPERAIRRIRDA